MQRLILAAIVCSLASSAFAQTPKDATTDSAKPATASVPAAPERTTASFGDWTLRCEIAAQRVCEVAEAITVQGQAAPIAQIAFGRANRGDPMRLTLVLPTNVALGTKPTIRGETDDASAIELSWERCLPVGCVASAVVADDVTTRLSRLTEPGNIVFQDAAERGVALPMSFRGLSQALAALAKEP